MALASTATARDGTRRSRASRNEDASPAPGDSRPKAVIARELLEAAFDATEALVAKRPDFALKLGLYSDSIYQGRILKEASTLGERGPESR